MFDMMKMMGKMKEMQSKMKDVQEKLSQIHVTEEAGAGMVSATVSGKKELIDLKIDDSLIVLSDKQMLQDLIVASVNKALSEVEVVTKEELKKSTEGILPDIPGMDIGGMFNG